MPPRRLRKQTKSKELSDPESEFEADDKDEESEEDLKKSVQKLVGKQKKSTTSKRQKGSTKRKEPSENSDSNSEILEIRHGDQFIRDHVRPEFLRRWDGESNELELFEEELRDMSPMFKVYWPIKARNMKAVVFLQFGKMQYFVFENDAILLSEISKKKLKTWSRYLMCNFWCKEVETVKRELFERRIPVLVMKEIEDPQYRAKYGIVRREVQEVITPAIHPAFDIKSTSRERLLLTIFKEGQSFAFVVLDSQTNEFLVQEIQEDRYLHEVRRIMNRHRPVELVIPRQNHDQIGQIAKQISNPHIVQLNLTAKDRDIRELLKTMTEQTRVPLLLKLKKKFEEETQLGKEFSRWKTVVALGLVSKYLEELSLKEKIFNQGLFSEGDGDSFRAPFFDSQVYQNLQLFRVKIAEDQTYCKPGTLLHYVDHCRTQQGRKMLHRWLDCPPANLQDVLQRQKAVCQLVENPDALKHHDKMIGYQKLNRKLGDIYHWIARESEKGKAILTKYVNFEKEYDPRKNPAVVRIREIVEVVNSIKEYQLFLKQFGECNFKSPLLSSKIQLQDIDNAHTMNWQTFDEVKRLPAIGYVADAVLRSVIYDNVTGSLEPAPGEIQTFDENKRECERIQYDLERELDKWKHFFDCSKVKYVSVRAKNEIEVPKSAIKKDGKTHPHKDLIFSSEIAGAVRYTTAETSSLSQELIQYEMGMAFAYEPFLQQLLMEFSKFRGLWDRYVQSSAWVDALMSLAQASKRMGVRCLPQFKEKGLSIIGATHPSLTELLDKVVPNSLVLKGEERVLLLTGPNMGGKSTLLKQTCLLVVLAQLGCYVPAVEYSAPIFDQIFCRIGASDRIHQGKSTFYVELQQTKLIMSKATANSLVVIDELGRGTSTYDGMAIAEAVLNNLIEDIRPITLFSTHYTQITERFNGNERVKLAKMGSEINEESLVFTYQLEEGVADKSFATNVVRIVGICKEIIEMAQEKTDQMHHQSRRKKMIRDACLLAKGRRSTGVQVMHFSPLQCKKNVVDKESNTRESKNNSIKSECV